VKKRIKLIAAVLYDMTMKGVTYLNQKLDEEYINKITNQYYSSFCAVDILAVSDGIHFICSSRRNAQLRGLGQKYPVFMLVKDDNCIITYSPKYKEEVEVLRGANIKEIATTMNQKYNLKTMQLMIFHRETIEQFGSARNLTKEDYPFYEDFFKTTSPNVNYEGWLYDYFIEKADKGLFTGYFSRGKLVCVCDAPDMPYLEGKIQHTGVRTLEEERRKGFAKSTAALATHNLLNAGICPQWECDAGNIASVKLAKSIGYKRYGVAYIMTQ